MGSGKSTLLSKLSGTIPDWQTFDLDHVICLELGIKRSELGDWIREHSLHSFRSLEYQCLNLLLLSSNGSSNKVIALGAGTLESNATRLLIKSHPQSHTTIKLIYLDVPLETCLQRVAGDKNRPMLELGPLDLKKLHRERLVHYREAVLILNESKIKEIEGIASLVHNLPS